jgi:hypothetical protein
VENLWKTCGKPVENLWKTFLLLSSNKKIFFLFEKIFV